MKILIVGDIVGSPGRVVFARVVNDLKARGEIDAVIVNAENAAGGRGLTPKLGEEIFTAGADAITMGDHTWDQKDIVSYLDSEPRIIRPANFAPGLPGQGHCTVETTKGKISIINLVGRVFTQPFDCPFRKADEILRHRATLAPTIIVDMHAEATSEKIAMGWHLDGRVSAVVGTHTHVQTSDERILPDGTAYLTDLGMTGSKDSVIGCNIEAVLKKFLTGKPSHFGVAKDNPQCEGVILDVDADTGKARKIVRVRKSA